jgi:hypothetical protein
VQKRELEVKCEGVVQRAAEQLNLDVVTKYREITEPQSDSPPSQGGVSSPLIYDLSLWITPPNLHNRRVALWCRQLVTEDA